MVVSLRKIADVCINQYKEATCPVSKRCSTSCFLLTFLFHIQVCETKFSSGVGYEKHLSCKSPTRWVFCMRERERESELYTSNTSIFITDTDLKPRVADGKILSFSYHHSSLFTFLSDLYLHVHRTFLLDLYLPLIR